MTLDECIVYFEEQSKEHTNLVPYDVDEKYNKNCKQLAEWLRELKAYKDFEDKGYVMCRFEVAQDDRHRTTKMVLDFSTKKLFDNIVEVDADE